VRLVAKHRRREMSIATRVWDTARDGARRQLGQSLRRLQTDHVDEWRLHNALGFDRLDAMTARDGASAAAIRARDEGLVRFVSISGHADPQLLAEALRRFPFDIALVAVSVLHHFIYSFAEEFLPVANRLEMGAVGIRVIGYKALAHVADRALRYGPAADHRHPRLLHDGLARGQLGRSRESRSIEGAGALAALSRRAGAGPAG
jgi:aryl-alcohol dehydrogenase-like predicted oxidoreductase